ncbi:MAG: PhzF family phenazine biosynthesis protein [Actinomycetota bacterium]|nr:PhzF family phenazine biosynthesis protein [Actinomycetota bacterium]
MVNVQRLAAFTTDHRGGNPAGVVVRSQHPPDEEMQRIAAAVGYSETAFLAPMPDQPRSYRVRYYSPLMEVPFCGHATIAAAVSLLDRVGPGQLRLLTGAGPVMVDAGYDDSDRPVATLTSPPPSVYPAEDALVREALSALDWSASDLDPRLPPARASAGASHLILAVQHRARLGHLEYDFDRLKALMMREGLVTLHLVWQEDPFRYHARDPFPVGGVVEDPATGAAAAAFGAYLRHFGLVAPPCRITIIQGEDMGRPSTLLVDLRPGQQSVLVSGNAVPVSD